MKKNKGINLSSVSLDPEEIKPEKINGNLNVGINDGHVVVIKPKKVFVPNKKEFIPELYVVLYTLEGHTTWRIFKGFWSTWEAEKKNMQAGKITASRVFKLVRLTGEFYETP